MQAFCSSAVIPRRARRPYSRHLMAAPRYAAGTPVMGARRPGTRSYGFSFRNGTSLSRDAGEPRAPAPAPADPRTNGAPPEGEPDAAESPPARVDAVAGGAAGSADAKGARELPAGVVGAPSPSGESAPVGEQAPETAHHSARSMAVTLPILGAVQVPGTVILAAVPLLWATYSITLKWLYRLPWALTPAMFNFLRLIVGLCMVLPPVSWATVTRPVIAAGAELGVWTVLTNILQFHALRHTTASRAAFLSQLSTVLVPLIAVACRLESRLTANVLISAPLSILGVALLTFDGAAPSLIGDGLMIGVAFVAATYILRSKKFSRLPIKALVASKTVFQTIYAGIYFFLTSSKPLSFVGATPFLIGVNVALVVGAGFFICYLATALQMRGQAMVSASEAAVIFTSNPLWASLLAIPLGERFGPKGFVGASLILVATGLASGIGVRQRPVKQVGKAG